MKPSHLSGLFKALVLAPLFLTSSWLQATPFQVQTFRPWAGYTIPNGIWMTGDLNADGRADVFHAVASGGYAHTWMSNGDGTFRVGTFRPWAGYAVPNGQWFMADISGDRRADVIHLVQGADYAHTWISNGDGTFRVGTFRPWAGYAIPNGVWQTADLNGDGRVDLVHIVQGADYAHTWMSNGDGTFRVGTFRPWAGYAMPNGQWLASDVNGDGRTDLSHIVNGGDYVHNWLSNGDGTFRVTTFRPWAGYAMPNGVWMTADYNGDGRADLCHAVASGDYVHTWTSNGDGTYRLSTFRPWAGYAIPNGLWMTGDFDADGRADIVHAVNASNIVHIWRSTGAGGFRVTTFSPWAGYAVPNGLWLPCDFTGDGRMDVLHAVQNSDYAHPWISRLPRPGEVSLDGIETTQGIQDMNQGVVLTSGKRTVVRAYVSYNSPSTIAVRGVLNVYNYARSAWFTVNSLNTLTINPALNDQIRPKRENIANSLNFELGTDLRNEGWYYMRLQVVPVAGGALACSDCVSTDNYAFQSPAATFRVRVLGLRYTGGSPAASHAPSAADYNLLRSWLQRAYPVSNVTYSSATIAATNAWPFNSNQANAQVAAVRALDVAGGRDRRTHYYGLVDNGGGFMRGSAAGIPGSPDPSVVASGPTGPSGGWDTDGSFGDWYGGHELAHTLGRMHPGFCGESNDDRSYPFSNGQLANADGAFVGLDLGDAALGIPMRALPGTVWRDVMTYCDNQWVSSYTYGALYNRIRAEEGLPAGMDLGSNFMAIARLKQDTLLPPLPNHPELVGNTTGFSLSGPPAVVTGLAKKPKVVTLKTNQLIVPAPSMAKPDLANLPTAYVGFDKPKSSYRSRPDVQYGMSDFFKGALQGSAGNKSMEAAQAGADPINGDYIHVVATINLTQKTGSIYSTQRLQLGTPTADDPKGEVVVRFKNANGSILGSHTTLVKRNSEVDKGEDETGIVDALLPWKAGTASVELLMGGKLLDSKKLGSSAPTGGPQGNTKSVEVAGLTQRGFEVRWSANDSDGDAITYHVQISTDEGKTWETIAYSQAETSFVFDETNLPEGVRRCKGRVLANDGINLPVIWSGDVSIEE